MRKTSEIRKRHLAGASPARLGQPGGPVATPCDGHEGESVRSGTATGPAMRRRTGRGRAGGARASRPSEVSPENWLPWVPTALTQLAATVSTLTRWHMRAAHPAGSRWTACSKKMTQEPGRPIRSVESRRPKARETEAGAECVVGVGGPNMSDDAGERVTPDPAEQRGSVRVGTNFRREP